MQGTQCCGCLNQTTTPCHKELNHHLARVPMALFRQYEQQRDFSDGFLLRTVYPESNWMSPSKVISGAVDAMIDELYDYKARISSCYDSDIYAEPHSNADKNPLINEALKKHHQDKREYWSSRLTVEQAMDILEYIGAVSFSKNTFIPYIEQKDGGSRWTMWEAENAGLVYDDYRNGD